jgi:RNA polymerase sigma-70 factor (ECF subfamily)
MSSLVAERIERTVTPPTRVRRPVLSAAVTDDGHAWDASMMRRVAAGDDSALAAIYDRYASLVHGLARRMLGAPSAADVCQEVFVALWRHPDRFDATRGPLPSYLATIAHRRCIDELRRTGRRVANEERALDPSPSRDEPETVGLQRLTTSAVRRALDLLPEAQRRAVELAYFQGLTFREVATATGVSEGTAKSRLRLARERLAVALDHLAPSALSTPSTPITPDVTP